MKVSGSASLHAPPDAVWSALNDPAVLVRTIPGCERLEATGPDSYRLTVTAGVASVRGTYAGEVSLADQQPPGSFTLKASGAGGPGTVSTEVKVVLSDAGDGSTTVSYDADAVVGGVIAGVGQRMLGSVARKMADDFFRSVDDVLTGSQPATVAADGAAPAPDQAVQAGPRVFTAPDSARRAAARSGFGSGVLTGAVIALAGVAIGALVGRDALS